MSNHKKNKENKFLNFAKACAPHGTDGGVRLSFYAGSFFDLSKVKKITFYLNGHYIDYEIKNIKGHVSNPILHFPNIKTIEDAKFLQSKEIYINKTVLKKLSINIPIELIGSPIFISSSKKQFIKLGYLKNILPGSNYEFFEIITVKEKEITVPFTDDFIKELNYTQKKIIASNKSGFFENEI